MDRQVQPAPRDESGGRAESAGCVQAILDAIPRDAGIERMLHGAAWVLSVVRGRDGRRAAGMAGVPHAMRGRCCAPQWLASPAGNSAGESDRVEAGHFARMDGPFAPIDLSFDATTEEAGKWADLLRSSDAGEAATGLAVANGLMAMDPAPAAELDGVAWLLERAADRAVAVVGHFPFADHSLRSVARQVWIIEREPGHGEYGGEEATVALAQADIVVITASAIANHTIDQLRQSIDPAAAVMLLGPSTPLLPALLDNGFDALSGVRVANVDAAAEGIMAGASFRQLTGLQRVTLLR